jgi:hypothetical protein
MKNLLAIYKFLKTNDFLKGKGPRLPEFLKNKYFVKEKSPSFA